MMVTYFNPLIAWGVLAVVLVLLGYTACKFSRRSYRLTALATVVVSVIALTMYGHTAVHAPPGKNYDVVVSFYTGSANVIREMIDPIASVGDDLLIAWGGVLAFCAAVLVLFDFWSTRRAQPRVEVPPTSEKEAGDRYFAERNHVTEELRFLLPAVSVCKPAVIPGGGKIDSIAAMVEASEVKGGKFTAALIRVVHVLRPQPRVYETRCFVQKCDKDGQSSSEGGSLRITVDMQDARTGQSLAVKVLPPCELEEAPKLVAGFAARQVFRNDPSTPEWAVGSKDGQDLASYLLSCESFPAGRTFMNHWESRRKKKEELERTVENSQSPGLIGYDLAAMYDLDGEYLQSLLLHLRNRINYPRFWAGRYRLAMSLYTLASHISENSCDVKCALHKQLPTKKEKDELFHKLSIAPTLRSTAMLWRISRGDQIAFSSLTKILLNGRKDTETVVALLKLAKLELRAYRRSAGIFRVLLNAFFHRPLRASLLQTLRGNWRVLHPWRRRLTAGIAIKAVKARIAIEKKEDKEKDRISKYQKRALRRLGVYLDKPPKLLELLERLKLRMPEPPKLPKGVPWQAAYNAACLYAMKPCENVDNATTLLRLAIESKECDLEHPSEVIAMDADFGALHKCAKFENFVNDLARIDFADGEKPKTGNCFIDNLRGFGTSAVGRSCRP